MDRLLIEVTIRLQPELSSFFLMAPVRLAALQALYDWSHGEERPHKRTSLPAGGAIDRTTDRERSASRRGQSAVRTRLQPASQSEHVHSVAGLFLAGAPRLH